MKYIFLLIVFSACTNKKAALVDRQRELSKELSTWNFKFDSAIRVERDILRTRSFGDTIFFDTCSEYKRNAWFIAQMAYEKSIRQETYDSLEWELKKY